MEIATLATVTPTIPGRLLVASIIALAANLCDAQVVFTEVGASRGIGSYPSAAGKIAGLAAADFDDDIDIFVPTGIGERDQLYENRDGQFFDIAAEAGVASIANHRSALFFDYDNDGALDLFVAGDCFGSVCREASLVLYRQVTPRVFEDRTLESGLLIPDAETDFLVRTGVCAGDINNDGYLDLCLAIWTGAFYLYRNNRDRSFTNISLESGVGGRFGRFYQPMMYDFDCDGWQDIFVTVDGSPNQLWINRKDDTFVDDADGVGLENVMTDMGVALGDHDNDGDLDLYITNITTRNEHNGWLDIATTNAPVFGEIDASRFFYSGLPERTSFDDRSEEFEFDDSQQGSALVALDYDGVGDLDLLQACVSGEPLRLLENNPTVPERGNYLVIRPRMESLNHRAIGAVVRVQVGDLGMMRLITAGTSMIGQEPAEAFFGLGNATAVDQVTIEWPDGRQSAHVNVPANQVLTISNPRAFLRGDCDTSGDLDINDAVVGLTYSFLGGQTSCVDACDVNDDGSTDVFDPLRLLFHIFGGSSPPEDPWPECGVDETADGNGTRDLGCETSGPTCG
jgi:hypothetical protein